MRSKRVMAVLLLLLAGDYALSQGLPDFPFVIVSGSASIDAPPDLAHISFALSSYDANSDSSLAALETAQKSVLDLIAEYNIPSEGIVAEPLQKYMRRRTGEDNSYEEIIGYGFTQEFDIKMGSLDKYADFVNSLIAIDNLSYMGQSFDSSKKNDLLNELVSKAGLDAKAKAQTVAASLGVEIKSVYAINEGGTGFGSFSAKFGIPGVESNISYAPGGDQRTMTLLVPKAITFSRRIDVVYRIAP